MEDVIKGMEEHKANLGRMIEDIMRRLNELQGKPQSSELRAYMQVLINTHRHALNQIDLIEFGINDMKKLLEKVEA